MDGDTAQWYARSRYTTSDWDRMKRQRELQTAILDQFTPQNVLDRFQEIADAGDNLVQTDMPQSDLPYFFELAVKAKDQQIDSIEFTPNNDYGTDTTPPDYAQIHQNVAQTLHPTQDGRRRVIVASRRIYAGVPEMLDRLSLCLSVSASSSTSSWTPRRRPARRRRAISHAR